MTQTILILLTTQFFAMMSPGPDMMLILKNTLGQPSRKPAVFTILGIGLGLSVHIGLSIGGLAVILKQSDWVYQLIRYTGAAYLGYLGVKALWSKSSPVPEDDINRREKTPSIAFREGLLTNLTNPKVTLFILSLFTQLIDPASLLWQKLTYGAILITQAIVVWILFALLVSLPGMKDHRQEWNIWMDRILGLILIGIAVSVIHLG